MITSIIIEVYSEASDDTLGKQPWKKTKFKDNISISYKNVRTFSWNFPDFCLQISIKEFPQNMLPAANWTE